MIIAIVKAVDLINPFLLIFFVACNYDLVSPHFGIFAVYALISIPVSRIDIVPLFNMPTSAQEIH